MAYITMSCIDVIQKCQTKIDKIKKYRDEKVAKAIEEKKKSFPYRFFNISNTKALELIQNDNRWISTYGAIQGVYGGQENTCLRLLALAKIPSITGQVNVSDKDADSFLR